jgi:hypothetical protein
MCTFEEYLLRLQPLSTQLELFSGRISANFSTKLADLQAAFDLTKDLPGGLLAWEEALAGPLDNLNTEGPLTMDLMPFLMDQTEASKFWIDKHTDEHTDEHTGEHIGESFDYKIKKSTVGDMMGVLINLQLAKFLPVPPAVVEIEDPSAHHLKLKYPPGGTESIHHFVAFYVDLGFIKKVCDMLSAHPVTISRVLSLMLSSVSLVNKPYLYSLLCKEHLPFMDLLHDKYRVPDFSCTAWELFEQVVAKIAALDVAVPIANVAAPSGGIQE